MGDCSYNSMGGYGFDPLFTPRKFTGQLIIFTINL